MTMDKCKNALQMIKRMRPVRSSKHKGDYGRVLVIGGSEEYAGAAMMAGAAAKAVLAGGADIVTVAAPEKVAWAINTLAPEIMTIKLRGRIIGKMHIPELLKRAERFDVIAIGNGIGRKSDPTVRELVKRLSMKGKLLVIDADALKAVRLQDCRNAILTPHAEELRILLKNSGIRETGKAAIKRARKLLDNDVILAKGQKDRILSRAAEAVNSSGNAIMTKAGTGDVLAGLCAGFLAMTREVFISACAAAYVNGAVGDLLLKKKGRTFTATDMIKNIYRVYK